jgi:hypothetical protein
MDERTLTAWLITEGLLQPGQIKTVLEEQLRLGQSGKQHDVIAVARRLDLITDEQLIDILEKTGYQPKVVSAPAPLASASGIVSAFSDPNVSDPSADTLGSTDGPVLDAVQEARSKRSPSSGRQKAIGGARSTSSRRRKAVSGSRKAISGTSSAVRRRPKSNNSQGLLVGAFAIPIGLAVLFVATSGPGPTYEDDDVTDVRPVAPGKTSLKPLLDDLTKSVAGLERSNFGDTKVRAKEIKRLQGIVRRLRAGSLVVSELQRVDRADRRLKALLGGGKKDPDGKSDTEDALVKARAEQAWSRVCRNFERILWLCLQQPRSAIQQGAEQVRGVNQREDLAKRIRHYSAKGPDGMAGLVGSEDLHPILGIGGYESLLRETDRFPDDLRDTELWNKWSKIVQQFEELKKLALDYTRSLRRAEDAAEVGDLAAAKAAFSRGPYADRDRWYAAVREFLDLPDVGKLFANRAGAIARGEPRPRGRVIQPTTRTGELTGWRDRFLALEREYRKAAKDPTAKQAAVAGLLQLLDDTKRLAERSFETCTEIVAVYDKRPKVFKAESALKAKLKEHHTLYFEAAYLRASGPDSFRSLDAWCAKRGYEAWRARLKPYLRLVAVAGGKKGRAREGKRKGRVQVKQIVAEFSDKRIKNVAEGLGQVVEWMRKRGYAPKAALDEMDGLIARGVERAGEPVAGARLRAELETLKDNPQDENRSSNEKGFRKQVDGVIKEAVGDSLKAVTKCVNAGEPGLGFDLFQYVLLLDPENDRAHKGLGHVKIEDKWVRKYNAKRLKQGYEWDSKLGWVLYKQKERYAKGEYYDLQTKAWTTVAAANTVHAQVPNCWVVQSEHFELRSTADLAETTRVVERLEAFYLSLFRQYDLFFMGKGGAALIFGMSPSQNKPLIVNYYRTRDQFTQFAKPSATWAAGFYSGGKHASFFYSSRSWTVLQHEIVHQILGETSSGGGTDSWLAEGAAVYLEDAFFRDGVLTLGDRHNHSRIVAYENGQRGGGQEHRMTDVLKFSRGGQAWDSGDISKNYRGAGAVVYFLCHFDGGRYRADFVEFLRAAYYGGRPKLEDFFGMPVNVLNELMQRFYVPNAKIGTGSGASASAEELAAAKEALVLSCGKKSPDLDQVSASYGLLRKALSGTTGKEADKARKRAGKAVVSMRKKLVAKIEKGIKKSVDKSGQQARSAKLEKFRAEALAIIRDKGAYPDENHGAVGQHLVDAKVKVLSDFWYEVPALFQEPEIAAAVALMEATEPWLVELDVESKKKGKTVADLRKELLARAGCAGLVLTKADQDREVKEAKVRDWNRAQTQIPDYARDQVAVLNDYREMLGLHLLALEQRLYTAAQKHADWMLQAGDMSHTQPNPATRNPSDRARLEGYTDGVSENVAFGYHTAAAVHKGWYTSSGHHRNMIGTRVFEIGVGKAGTYWGQLFGMRKPVLN